MVHRNIDNIELPIFLWKKINPLNKVKPNLSFDTETIGGRCFLISDSNGRHVNNHEFNDLYGLLMYLNNREYNKSVNWFYNLGYDTNALLHFLSFEDRTHIAEFNEVDCEDFRISIIPEKQLKIGKIKNDKMTNPTYFFDLAQFYDFKPLKILAEQTNYDKVYVDDISQINIKKYYLNNEYHKLINDRCIIDCKITNEIADKLTNNIQKIVNVDKYRSKASIARRYVLENLTKNLKMPSTQVMDAALQAYHAGHIETCKLGLFDNVHNVDINSAYPFQTAELYETSGAFVHNQEYLPDTAYSFYHISVDYQNDFLSPLWFTRPDGNYHVTGKFDTWVIQSEIEYLMHHEYDFTINKAYHIKKTRLTEQPFKDLINDLYQERLKAKDNKDDIEKVYKVILNSIYGVTINVVNKKEISDYETDTFKIIDNKLVFYKSTFKATNMYNPVYGTTITGNTRVKIFTDFNKYLKYMISVNTDGVYLTKNHNVKVSKKLGEYSYKKLNKIMFMGSGRYFLFDNDNMIDNKESRFRSVPKEPSEIYDIMKNNKNVDSIKLTRQKPIKLKESIRNSDYYNKFNEFQEVTKQIYFKTDRRYWFNEVDTINDLWTQQINSRPYDIQELQ